MDPSQANNEENTAHNDHEERVNRIDSEIMRQKEQLLKEFEDSSDDSRKRRPKCSRSERNRLEISQIKPPILSFAPFEAKTLQLRGDKGIFFDAASYNEKYNMIIACPEDRSVQFYNATTLLPFEETETRQLDNATLRLSYWPQSETYLLGCLDGGISSYNLSSKVLKKVQEKVREHIITLTFLNSRYYAFAALDSGCLSVGDLENGDILNLNLKNGNNISCLFRLKKANILISSLINDSVQVYRVDSLPRLPICDTIRGFKAHDYAPSRNVQSMIIGGKEYILMVRADRTIQLWHLIKGKMKRLKVIHTLEEAFCMVYLEDYKMLATTHNTQYIRFWRLPSGILESVIDLKMQGCYGIFLMKDKDCIGISSVLENKIKIVKLSL